MLFHNFITILALSFMGCFQTALPQSSDPNEIIKSRLAIMTDSLKNKKEEAISRVFSDFLKEEQDDAEWKARYRETLRLLDATNSPLRNEDMLIPFLHAALESGKLGEGDKMRAEFRLEIAMKNRPGTPAADFKFIDRKGKQTHLKNVRSEKPILLIFYDPDCSHCMQTINDIIGQQYDKAFTVLAIDIAEDADRWRETKDSLPEEWTAGYSGPTIEDEDLYALLDTPTIYILTKDRNVAIKDVTFDKLKAYISSK